MPSQKKICLFGIPSKNFFLFSRQNYRTGECAREFPLKHRYETMWKSVDGQQIHFSNPRPSESVMAMSAFATFSVPAFFKISKECVTHAKEKPMKKPNWINGEYDYVSDCTFELNNKCRFVTTNDPTKLLQVYPEGKYYFFHLEKNYP